MEAHLLCVQCTRYATGRLRYLEQRPTSRRSHQPKPAAQLDRQKSWQADRKMKLCNEMYVITYPRVGENRRWKRCGIKRGDGALLAQRLFLPTPQLFYFLHYTGLPEHRLQRLLTSIEDDAHNFNIR